MYWHIRFKMFFLFRTLAMSKTGENYCHCNFVEVHLLLLPNTGLDSKDRVGNAPELCAMYMDMDNFV